MDKKSLRRQYLTKRKSLPKDTFHKKNQAIAQLFLDHISLKNYSALHTFLPIKKNREVDTFLLIQQLRERYPELVLVVPKIHNSELLHYILEEDTLLGMGPYQVPEPQEAKAFDEKEIEIILVPLLLFDRHGHRIGYGKGYYDRFLQQRPNALKIGLSLYSPIDQIPQLSPQDVALNMVVTPEQIYQFS